MTSKFKKYIAGALCPFLLTGALAKGSIAKEKPIKLDISDKVSESYSNLDSTNKDKYGEEITLKSSLNKLFNLFSLYAGIATGILIHEGSHYAVANHYEMNPNYNLKNPTAIYFNENSKSNKEKAMVNGAGLMGQTLATEIILNTPQIPKDNPYVLGILAFNIADNLRYGIVPNLRGKEGSDVHGLKETGLNEKLVRSALIGHSIFSIYRLFADKKFKKGFDYFTDKKTKISVNATNKGLGIGASYKF